jgi:hypothetical protein
VKPFRKSLFLALEQNGAAHSTRTEMVQFTYNNAALLKDEITARNRQGLAFL